MTTTTKGVWLIQDVRTNILADEWVMEYNALGDPASIFTWGSNNQGQLGQNNTSLSSSPIQVPGLWVKVAVGGASVSGYTMIINHENDLFSFGTGTSGQLGTGTAVNRSSPVQVVGKWKDITAGDYHCLGLKPDNTLWAWGFNDSGRLGVGDVIDRSSPTQILGSWLKISAANQHSGGIREDGTLWLWGNGGHGRLANDPPASTSSPVQVPGIWIDVSVGGAASTGATLAIRDDNTLWAWGNNTHGDLGQNNTIHYSSPVQIPGEWISISKGGQFSFGIKSDKTLWAWGRNVDGALGVNDTVNYSSPVQISGLWRTIRGTNTTRSFGIKDDNTLWGWGNNSVGRLGINLGTGTFSSPIQIPGQWVDVSASFEHGSALKTN